MNNMKISAFYVTKNQKVIEGKDLVNGIGYVAQGVALAKIGEQALPIIYNTMGMGGIVAHASTVVDGASTTPNITQAVAPIIQTLQDLAEPFSYGFAIKGIMQKMSGKENEGTKTLKNALGGYVVVQFLPEVYKLLRLVEL